MIKQIEKVQKTRHIPEQSWWLREPTSRKAAAYRILFKFKYSNLLLTLNKKQNDNFSNLFITHKEVKGNPIIFIIKEGLLLSRRPSLTFKCVFVSSSIWFHLHRIPSGLYKKTYVIYHII